MGRARRHIGLDFAVQNPCRLEQPFLAILPGGVLGRRVQGVKKRGLRDGRLALAGFEGRPDHIVVESPRQNGRHSVALGGRAREKGSGINY